MEPLRPDELRGALACLLAAPGSDQRAGAAQVGAFLGYLESGAAQWEGLCCRAGNSMTALFFALMLPGATAIVMVPTPGELGIQPAEQTELTLVGMQRLAGRRLHYAQALLLSEAHGQRRLLEQAGFRPLAPLLYLERDTKFPWIDAPDVAPGDWVAFSAATRSAFADMLLATYEDSLDCPELTGLRPIDDVIAAHQASGQFDPAWWELLRRDGRAVGCMLLSRLPHTSSAEVVYTGVVPEYRRRGIGSLLLRRALQRCREAGVPRLTLVVDERNGPARRFYDSFAFRQIARREAFFCRWPSRV